MFIHTDSQQLFLLEVCCGVLLFYSPSERCRVGKWSRNLWLTDHWLVPCLTADWRPCVLLLCVSLGWTRHQPLLLAHTYTWCKCSVLLPGLMYAELHVCLYECRTLRVTQLTSVNHFSTFSLYCRYRHWTVELNQYLILHSARQTEHKNIPRVKKKKKECLLKFILATLPGELPLSSCCPHSDDACAFVCVFDYLSLVTPPHLRDLRSILRRLA